MRVSFPSRSPPTGGGRLGTGPRTGAVGVGFPDLATLVTEGRRDRPGRLCPVCTVVVTGVGVDPDLEVLEASFVYRSVGDQVWTKEGLLGQAPRDNGVQGERGSVTKRPGTRRGQVARDRPKEDPVTGGTPITVPTGSTSRCLLSFPL